MRFVVMDLEWNGAYCRQTRGYFNEIIEIGAVRLDGRPAAGRRISRGYPATGQQ